MKRLISVFFVFLCGSCFLAGQEKASEEELPPDPAKDMVGSWQGFLMNGDDPVSISSNRYRFLDSGTWEILEEKDGAKAVPQGWYKVSEKQLYLQPKEMAEKNEDAAIPAELRDKNSFAIQNPFEGGLSLLFMKTDVLTNPAMGDLEGKWKITQKDPESKETHVAPSTLVLRKDGTYRVEQPGKELPAEWAEGTYTVSGIRIQLKNDFTGEGLWNAPAFFLLDEKLRYDNGRYCVWCEKLQ